MEKVLLISPTWVGLHLDILRELERQGMCVEFCPEFSFPADPGKVLCRHPLSDRQANTKKEAYWRAFLSSTDTAFDFVLVIDGQGLNQFLFDELKRRNPGVRCVCYLYDTTYSLYHFESQFKYFDHVFTFDRKDAKVHQLGFLPIYWLDIDSRDESIPSNRVFGFGAYSKSRYRLYHQVKEIADGLGIDNFIKLYHKSLRCERLYGVYCLVRRIFGMKEIMSLDEYQSGMISSSLITTKKFREMVAGADVILDTKVLDQDGLTARFMWALGYGKKIITTNDSVRTYDFYSPRQIMIVEDKEFNTEESRVIMDFITAKYEMSNTERSKILPYRLDNWLKTLLNAGLRDEI